MDIQTAVIAQQQQQWFFSTGGERFGPVGFDYLLELAQGGRLDPRNDLVWSTSLNDWEPAGEVAGLFERRSVPKDEYSLDHANSLAQTGDFESSAIPKARFPGTGRLGYVMGITLVPALLVIGWQFAVPLIKPYAPEAYAGYLPFVVWPLAGLLVLTSQVKRFQNLGMTGWWLLGLVVPFLNLWLGYRCLACPGGYATAKKLDGMGKLLAVLYWGAVIGGIGLSIAAMVGALGELKDSGMISEVTKQFEELRKSAVPER